MGYNGGIPDSAIVSGKYNIVERRGGLADQGENLIGAGAYNRITNSQYSTIVAGTRNIIHNSGTNPLYYGGGFIGAGSGNTLGTSLFHTIGSSILGGASNSIGSDAGTVQYAAIVNGRANIIGHNYSAIIGGQGLASNASHTTFMNGLDSDTDSVGGTRPLKYHGGYANEGLGRILTSDALETHPGKTQDL